MPCVEGVSSDILDRLPSAQWLEKEVILRVQTAGPSSTSAEFLANSGPLVLRITNSKRSLIIGDRPGATVTIRIGATSQRHFLQFVAVAWDCALVAVPNAAGRVGVGHVVDADVRGMNEATLAKSSMIAGRSE